MKPKTMILMGVAITCGLGASYMTSRLLSERAVETVEQPKVKILVARKNLDTGAAIKNPHDMFEEKNYIQGEEPKDAIRHDQHEQLKGRVLKNPLRPGDFVTHGDLLGHDQAGLSAKLPAGHRAIGLQIGGAATVAGFASLPGSRVDILTTLKGRNNAESFTQVLLENVLVLAVDGNQHRSQDNTAMPGNIVTFALSQPDVLKVENLKDMGRLSLALRKFNDQTPSEVGRMTVEETLNGPKKQLEEDLSQPPAYTEKIADLPPPDASKVEVKVARNDPKRKQHVVRIVEGNAIRHKVFILDENDNVIESSDQVPGESPAPAPALPAPTLPAPAVPAPPSRAQAPAAPAAPTPDAAPSGEARGGT